MRAEQPTRSRASRVLMAAGAVALAALLFGVAWARYLSLPVAPGDNRPVLVTIPRGEGTVAIGRLLAAQGLVRNPYAFAAQAFLTGSAGHLEAGEYQLSPAMDLADLVGHLAKGDVVTVRVTIPEGFTIDEIIATLVRAGLGSQAAFAAAAQDRSLVAGLLPAGAQVRWPVEGFLFPDTYHFTHDLTPHQILEAMVKRFRAAWPPPMAAAAAGEQLSLDQVVTLASIVERETRSAADRPKIAGVYLNRLHKNMPLGADPTVLYALGRAGGELSLADLKVDSPFNTYAHTGLPPGPIDSPSLASVDAVLHPASVPYYYFLARPDGTIAYAVAYTEQLANIRQYRRS